MKCLYDHDRFRRPDRGYDLLGPGPEPCGGTLMIVKDNDDNWYCWACEKHYYRGYPSKEFYKPIAPTEEEHALLLLTGVRVWGPEYWDKP